MIELKITDLAETSVEQLDVLIGFLTAQRKLAIADIEIKPKQLSPFISDKLSSTLKKTAVYHDTTVVTETNSYQIEPRITCNYEIPVGDEKKLDEYKIEETVTSEQLAELFTQAAQQTEVEKDSSGIVWDSRIHAANKSKLKSGQWRKKSGVSTEYYNSVVAEQSVPTLIQSIEDKPEEITFDTVYTKITTAIAEDKMTPDSVRSLLASFGLENIPALATKPELIPPIYEALSTGDSV